MGNPTFGLDNICKEIPGINKDAMKIISDLYYQQTWENEQRVSDIGTPAMADFTTDGNRYVCILARQIPIGFFMFEPTHVHDRSICGRPSEILRAMDTEGRYTNYQLKGMYITREEDYSGGVTTPRPWYFLVSGEVVPSEEDLENLCVVISD